MRNLFSCDCCTIFLSIQFILNQKSNKREKIPQLCIVESLFFDAIENDKKILLAGGRLYAK